jgi:DNA polymerase
MAVAKAPEDAYTAEPFATAGKALLGSSFRVGQVRGAVLEEEINGRPHRLLSTVHPASVLRADDREDAYKGFVQDPEIAARLLA